MPQYSITTDPPAGWQALCKQHRTFFGTPEWQSVLERSFRCRTLYVWSGASGWTVTVFRLGPFRVGYLGFPVGGRVGPSKSWPDFLDDLRRSGSPELPICIRIPVSGFDDVVEYERPAVSTPETAIVDLQHWNSASVSKNLRRDIRRAERAGFELAESPDTASGSCLYAIYSETVRRKRGSLRYNEAYFASLVELCKVQSALRMYVALDGPKVAGFAITARHHSTTYYLHGGAADEYRRRSPSDLLLDRAIRSAKADGAASFNLMASPANQPMLLRYKEKWGATTRVQKTYTVSMGRAYPLFGLAERLYKWIR